jgi:oxygen-dependent protoporphyrinogen oxidase
MPDTYRVVVVGGGVTGLCAAFYLSQKYGKDQVLLLEADDRLGGQTRTTRENGFVCDWGPNGFLDRESLTLKWAEDLGLTNELVRADEAAAHRFILRDGQLREIPLSPPKFLTSPILSLPGRLRVLAEPLIRSKTSEIESLWGFGARRIGKQAADFMIDPMASGIFGGDSKKLALAACFPRMMEMEHDHGSLFGAMLAKRKTKKNVSASGPAGVLTSFEQGIGYLPDQIAKRDDFEVRTRTSVKSFESNGDGYTLNLESETVQTKALVLALPAFASAEVVGDFDAELTTTLKEIPFASMTVICAGYRREMVGHDLNGFGFLVPRNQNKRVLGCIWTSSVFGGRSPEGWVQLRTMIGGANDPDAINLSDKELIELFRRDVGPLVQVDSDPEFLKIFRWPRAIAQYNIGHLDRMRQIEAAEIRHPGLVLAGNSYRGVGLNDCVVSAHRAVDLISAF